MEILVISGLSGAGKSCAASCLEDIGYYTVDNMPAAIIPKFAEFSAESDGRYDRVALVNDIRGGVDSFQELLEVIDRLREGGTVCRLLYLEADTQSIIKRYKETRRRHPLMESGATIEDAVKRETELLRPLRERADFVIDTTQLSAAKLRGELYRLFAEKGQQSRMSINVVSFGYKYGVPLEADLVFDVRFMPNPYYVPELRYQTTTFTTMSFPSHRRRNFYQSLSRCSRSSCRSIRRRARPCWSWPSAAPADGTARCPSRGR